jgi:hypothetical protein
MESETPGPPAASDVHAQRHLAKLSLDALFEWGVAMGKLVGEYEDPRELVIDESYLRDDLRGEARRFNRKVADLLRATAQSEINLIRLEVLRRTGAASQDSMT